MSYFYDIDNDGKIEELELSKRKKPCNSINFKRDDKYLNVYNLLSNEVFISRNLSFADLNKDGITEIYFISVYEKKVYLNIIEYDKKLKNKRIFVDSCKHFNGAIDISNNEILFDKNNIIFNLVSGFTIQPRKLYSYNYKNKILKKSPHSSININNFMIVKNDSSNFVLVTSNIAVGNTLSFETLEGIGKSKDPDSIRLYHIYKKYAYKYGDFSSYNILFDKNMNFKFPPIEYKGWTKMTTADIIKINNEKHIVSLTISEKDTSDIPIIEIINFQGEIIKRKKLKNYSGTRKTRLLRINKIKNEILIYDTKLEEIIFLNANLEEINRINIKNNIEIFGFKDINYDDVPEFIIINRNNLIIYQNDFLEETKVPIHFCGINSRELLVNSFKKKNKPFLSIEIGDSRITFSYVKNKIYYLRYFFYIVLIVLSYLFIIFIQKINSKRLEKEKEKLEIIVIERTSELNQMNEELKVINEDLNQQKEEIRAQAENLMEINKLLSEKNEEIKIQSEHLSEANSSISLQKKEIEKSHKNVKDSINHARRIQRALLPSSEEFSKEFYSHFILYKPKDIVSGDFYYLKKVNEFLVFAAADCTGHGVPGAFVSMLGISFLNEIIRKKNVKTASKILEELRAQIKVSLKQSNKSVFKDGMDIALCIFNTKTHILQFAGAYNPLYIIRNNELIEKKATKNPIGIFLKEKPFENNEIKLQNNDKIYIFSDGYADQFGGKKNKKFMSKNFKKLVIKTANEPFEKQKEIMNETIEKWRGNNQQIDDILVMGLNISQN
ncbi:MAG: hypothetical protein B6I24_09365 [Bacteroidetes bacterium 4572_128]|nr:MAG: hypothetical protein B6I24_09365 [Bacteroidetes bacterium 4572_128]